MASLRGRPMKLSISCRVYFIKWSTRSSRHRRLRVHDVICRRHEWSALMMAEFGESALGSWVEHAFGSRIASQGGCATIESQDRRINMSEPEEDPEDDERSERFSDSMQRFLEISIPKIPVIPPDIFDSAALGFSAPLFETVRKAAESQTNQIQAMFSTLPRLDFASLLPPASLNLASQIGKAFEMPNRALLDNLIPTVSLNALRFDVENAFSNVI